MAMKHYFLVSITIPDRTKAAPWQLWLGFLNSHPTHKEAPKGIERLAENVWLIPRDNGVSFLSSLVYEAAQIPLTCTVRFLTEGD